MSILVWVGQHRWWLLGAGAVLMAALAAAVWFFLLHSPGTRLDLGQALRLYRQDQDAAGRGGGGRLPSPGVYRYQTAGGEQLSIGGISRSFPGVSEMIVTDAGGCASMKWEPLVQHVEGLTTCPGKDGSIRVASASSYEEIAGGQTSSVIRCPADTYLVPPDPTVGRRWRTVCHSTSHEKVVFSGRLVGASTVEVEGRRVPALHTRLTLTFSGSTSGTNPNNYWVTAQDGLILRQRETVDVSQQAGPLGSVRYGEQMAINLRSLSPVR